MLYLGKLSVGGQVAFPYIKMEPLSINLVQEDGSVRLRWRIAYLNWLYALNWKSYKPEYREKNVCFFLELLLFKTTKNLIKSVFSGSLVWWKCNILRGWWWTCLQSDYLKVDTRWFIYKEINKETCRKNGNSSTKSCKFCQDWFIEWSNWRF